MPAQPCRLECSITRAQLKGVRGQKYPRPARSQPCSYSAISIHRRKQYQYYDKQCKPALATATIATKPAWAPAKHSTGRTGRSLHVLACPWRQATLARSCHNVSTCLCQAAHYHGITSECPALEIKMCMTTAIVRSHVVRLMDPRVDTRDR
jgi:hypothetical protein